MRVMAAGSRLTLRKALKVTLSRGVGALGHTVDAADDGVERLGIHGQFAALGLLDRVAEAAASVLVAEVGQGGDIQGGGE